MRTWNINDQWKSCQLRRLRVFFCVAAIFRGGYHFANCHSEEHFWRHPLKQDGIYRGCWKQQPSLQINSIGGPSLDSFLETISEEWSLKKYASKIFLLVVHNILLQICFPRLSNCQRWQMASRASEHGGALKKTDSLGLERFNETYAMVSRFPD